MRSAIFSYAMLSRVASIIGMRKTTLASLPIIQLLLARVAAVFMCAFLAALLSGVLIVGFLWFIYLLMIENGLSPNIALLMLGAIIIFVITTLWMLMVNYAHTIHKLSKQLITTQYPVSNRISGVANSFIDGVMGKKNK